MIVLGPVPCQGCREPLWWGTAPSRWMGIQNRVKRAWREEDGTLHQCPEWQLSLARARAKWDNGAGGVSTEPNRLTAAAAAVLLTPGDGRRAASRE